MITRHVGTQTFNLAYDAENRLVTVSGSATAAFVYDGDGARVKSVMDGATTIFVGSHYEKVGTSVTKYYMAGASRVAMRKDGTLSFLLADHLGSSSISTDASGNRTSELRYKAWGETRFSFGTMPTKYTFTGQYAYTDDPSTPGSEGFGLMYYGARWFDPSIGRFTSPDTIVPTGTQGTQAWDRYAYVNNNPVRYTDPTGHDITGWCGNVCSGAAKFFDWVGAAISLGEAAIVDQFAVDVIVAGCSTGVGCGPAIGAALIVDGLIAGPASPIGAAENAAGVAALAATVLDDISNGSTYLEQNEAGELTLGIGQNTIVSATTMVLGLFPEANFDLSVSVAQLTYDYTFGEDPTTLVEFSSGPLLSPEPFYMEACIPKPGTSCSE